VVVGKICLIVASLVFYGYAGLNLLGILVVDILFNYGICLYLLKKNNYRKAILTAFCASQRQLMRFPAAAVR